MGHINLGKKITEFRRVKDLTIREFSEITGLSASLLSQLERNIGNPTLSALQAIAAALNIPLSELLTEEVENADLILRKENRKKIFDPDAKHVLYDMLTQSASNSPVELLLMHLKSDSETYGGFSEHDGEEIAYVLKGDLLILFEHEQFDITEGDTVRILPARKHMFKNMGPIDAEVLFIKSKLFK